MSQKPPVCYTITASNPHTHVFHITLRIQNPAARQKLALPVWIPGSYLVREFARHLQGMQVQQGGQPCTVQQIDKHRWQVQCAAGKPLDVHYQVYAYDDSVRTAWLDANRGFFNATSLCLMVEGQTAIPHHIVVEAPFPHWELATALEPVKTNRHGFGLYRAANYDVLADSPVEMGAFWSANFTVHGVPHRFVIANPPPALDGTRLLRDTRRICETAMRFWHGNQVKQRLPFQHYVFMLNAVADGYGGLEHANSTALIASRKMLPLAGQAPGADYVTLLGLISHEYFHTWNVKRLKPASFLPYDYSRENYTELLWFFEGLTSYYDDLLLLRAGCIDLNTYIGQLQKTLDNVRNSPGRLVHSVAQASFEAWTKYYRPDANTPNMTVSYYTKGALVGLCLDLTLRREGKTTLDAVLRTLYQRCYAATTPPRGLTEKDLLAVLQELGGRSFAREIRAWVHGTKDLPLKSLLQRTAITLAKQPAPPQQQWGLRCKEGAGGIHITTVLRDSAAEASGMAPGDEWLGLEIPATAKNGTPTAWRIGSLEDVATYLPPSATHAALSAAALAAIQAQNTSPSNNASSAKVHMACLPCVTAIIARDRRLIRLPLVLPVKAAPYWKLQANASITTKQGSQRQHWPWV